MTEKDALDIFGKKNALLSGHFKLSSGLHSEKYLQCALVLQYPDVAEKFAKEIAKRFIDNESDIQAKTEQLNFLHKTINKENTDV